MLRIRNTENRTAGLISELLDIWESSVKATHCFLSEEEIGRIKGYVPQALRTVSRLLVAEEDGKPVAFAGIDGQKLEMLFVSAEKRGRGIGKKLLRYAVENHAVRQLTVNEQNPQAVGFYEHMGFKAYGRSDTDEQGNPYPVLYMKKTIMKDAIMNGPDPDKVFPNEQIPSLCFIKNVITRPNIIVGDYTYYDDDTGADKFEEHVTHHYEFIGDKLIIGKFCAIGKGVEFIMNGANHRMNGVTTYPFNILGGGWEKCTPRLEDLPLKGDTVVGNDVWIGQNVTVLPGVHIGDGAVVGANSVVSKDVPPYHIVGGNPIKVIRKRFDDDTIACLLRLKWWDWPAGKITENLEFLCGGDLSGLGKIK